MKTYDEKSYELADYFLDGALNAANNTPENRDLLAKDIQQAVEDFFAEKEIDL